MKIAIIEDEPLTAQDLAQSIKQAEPTAEVVATLASVKEAVDFLNHNANIDVIFSDIQLGDGLSFDIFAQAGTTIPVIFCTAYDEYALHAFRTAGIDYILKPFTVKTIAAAIAKYKSLQNRFAKTNVQYDSVGKTFEGLKKQKAVLVFYKEKIMPVKLDDIALFYLQNDITHLITFAKQQYFITESLEDIEQITGPTFYRANRQYLVNHKAIKDVSKYFGRKLLLNLAIAFDEKITVSKEKAAAFLQWLADN